MAYDYPLDIDEVTSHAEARGESFMKYLGIRDDMRPDGKWTLIAYRASTGWFPVTSEGRWHGVLDLGLPDWGGDSISGMKVKAIADGTVVFADDNIASQEGFELGRVILRHTAPGGEEFYAQYRHLDPIVVVPFQEVKAGAELGRLGWHGDFPHLGFGIAALSRIGGDDDLIPEFHQSALPSGDGAWNVLRVAVDSFDPVEWPVDELSAGPGYVFNPVEVVRYCRGEAYEHDIGPGSLHGCEPLITNASPHPIRSDDDNEIVVPLLVSKELSGNKALLALAGDPDFAPIDRKNPDQEMVSCIQRALKACHYDLGRFGPEKDGVDGDYGNTTLRVVKEFQNNQLKDFVRKADEKGILGKTEADARTDGKIDWLTLIGLDACAAAHKDVAPPQPKPTAAPPPPPPAPPPPKPAAGGWVFDAQSKKLSLEIGMRMYKALLGWESDGTNGVGYSTCNKDHYGTVIPKELSPEWPDVGLSSVATVEVDGATYSKFKCFGVNWVGSNFTNCCNSQMAALTIALGGKTFGIKKADGTTVDYDITDDKVRTEVKAKKGGKMIKRGALVVFEQTFVSGMLFYDAGDNPLYGGSYGGMIYAIKFLEIGEPLFKFTKKQEDLKKMRVGDPATYDGHAWLVGDIRYGVWFEGNKNEKPDAILDQASFIDNAAGTLVLLTKKTNTRSADGRKPMTAADCDWVTANEAEFERRIQAFLEARKLTAPGGSEKNVDKVEVVHWRVFSANGNKKTAHSKQYDLKDGKFELNEKATQQLKYINGITRPWCGELKKAKDVAVGRYYGPVR